MHFANLILKVYQIESVVIFNLDHQTISTQNKNVTNLYNYLNAQKHKSVIGK